MVWFHYSKLMEHPTLPGEFQAITSCVKNRSSTKVHSTRKLQNGEVIMLNISWLHIQRPENINFLMQIYKICYAIVDGWIRFIGHDSKILQRVESCGTLFVMFKPFVLDSVLLLWKASSFLSVRSNWLQILLKANTKQNKLFLPVLSCYPSCLNPHLSVR